MVEYEFQEWYKDQVMPSDEELNELEHYGVLGMKWGVRRYQDYPPGKSGRFIGEKKKNHNTYSEAAPTLSSKKKNDRNKKIKRVLLATAGVSVAAVGAYALSKKYSGDFIDKTLKAGTKLRTITDDYATSIFSKEDLKTLAKDMTERGLEAPRSFLDERQRFYASYKDPDVRKYFINLGGQLLNKQKSGAGYVVTTAAKKDLKVASLKNAKKAFSSLYEQDSDFRIAVDANLFRFMQAKGTSDKQFNTFRYGMRDLAKGKMTDRAYKAFNASLVERDGSFSRAADKFYKQLKDSGYSAVEDLNDKFLSQYRTRSPLIVFDKSSVNVQASKKFTEATKITAKELLTDANNSTYLKGVEILKKWFDG